MNKFVLVFLVILSLAFHLLAMGAFLDGDYMVAVIAFLFGVIYALIQIFLRFKPVWALCVGLLIGILGFVILDTVAHSLYS